MSHIETIITNTSARWGIENPVIRNDLAISGSPERSELRAVIEDRNSELFVIESILHEDLPRKQSMIQCLNQLNDNGLSKLNPYIRCISGTQIVPEDNRLWILSRYIPGVELVRPDYVFDLWRAEPLADFLIDFRQVTAGLSFTSNSEPFSIKDYIHTLLRQVRKFNPEVITGIESVLRFLERRLMPVHNSLPVAFCHGDYHPMNIIWSSDSIRTVIDWEFHGFKPEMYDIANLLGCIGMEDPEGLAGDMVKTFIRRILDAGIVSDISCDILIDYMIALRFAWMAEWLRHKDREMIELETVYMNLLVTNYDTIKELWEIG